MGLLYKSVEIECLEPGDHIYSSKTDYIHANHGIFVGDNIVIHFTPAGAGTLRRTAPPINCPHCRDADADCVGVLSSCLACFHSGSILYRVEYNVYPSPNPRDGTCILANAKPSEYVVRQAKHLLEEGSLCYDVFKNNREDFAIFCKTGLLVFDEKFTDWRMVGGPLAAVLYMPRRVVMFNQFGMLGVYWAGWTLSSDLFIKVSVERLSAKDLISNLEEGLLTIAESEVTVNPIPRQMPVNPVPRQIPASLLDQALCF